ncbi:MAG: hypothetical protein JW918_14760 [Anaerolineae bacterium]|nr:hypothetical protein [Anaerolineae bacterium]
MKQIGKKLRLITAVISILTVVSVITVLAAEVVIDAFSDQSQNVSYTIPASPTFPHQICDYATTTSGTLGGHRDICLTITGGNQDSIGRLQVSTANEYLLMALDPSITAIASLQWDGTDATPSIDPVGLQTAGVGVDLTDLGSNDGIVIRVVNSDGLAVDMTLRIYTNATSWAQQTVTFDSQVISPNEVVDVFMRFADFGGGSGTMNPANVGAVELELDGTIEAGADMTIQLVKATSLYDFGDLPSGYNVTRGEGGPQHRTGPLRLGGSVDAEGDGTHSGTAVGDDNDFSPDDEDGVTRVAALASTTGGWTNGDPGIGGGGNGGSLDITISGGSGTPQVFVDFGSGLTEVTLRDCLSGNALTMPLAEGTHRVCFSIPAGTFDGVNPISIPVRVRLSSAGGLGANGVANDGEVEDYIWNFGPNAVALSDTGTRSGPILPALAAGTILLGAGTATPFILRKRREAQV